MEERLRRAKFAVIRAGDYLAKEFVNKHYVQIKPDQTELLGEDLESEKIIMDGLSKFFPNDSFLTEEQKTDIKSDYVWVIDPLCGTYSYLRGVETWSVSLALISGGEYLLGIVVQPLLSRIYFSQKGKGAFQNDKQIHVSKINKLDQAFVAVEHGVFNSGKFDTLSMIKQIKRLRVGHGSGGELAYIAAGSTDGLIKTNQALMHFAGGRAILEEAGGVFMDFSGQPAPTFLDRNKTIDYVACNQYLAPELLKYVLLT